MPGLMRLALGLLGAFWAVFFIVGLGGTLIFAVGLMLGAITG